MLSIGGETTSIKTAQGSQGMEIDNGTTIVSNQMKGGKVIESKGVSELLKGMQIDDTEEIGKEDNSNSDKKRKNPQGQRSQKKQMINFKEKKSIMVTIRQRNLTEPRNENKSM